MMSSTITQRFVGALAIALMANVATAQVATSLLNEGDTLGPPGDTISAVGNPAVNHAGGYSVGVTTTGSATLSHVWGTADGISAPALMATEGAFGPLTQTSFESFYGISNSGQVCYSASGNGGPDGLFDSVWIDGTPVAVEGDPLPAGPLSNLFWSFASRPSITADGTHHFVGGTRTTVGGSTSARGLFDNTGTPLLYSGDAIPGLPAVLDDTGFPVAFDYRFSALGTNYIAEVEMETVDTPVTTSDDGVMIFNGLPLMAGGSIVRENQPVPAAIGGLAGENWDNFDYTSVTEAGSYIFTGDTTAATTQDEIVVVNGVIVAREGQPMDGHDVSGAIEGAYMNENGDWAVIWDINDPMEGNIEALFFNGVLLIKENDEVDFDGDGVVDAGAIISNGGLGFTGTSTLVVADRAGGVVSVYFTADVSDNGATLVEGFYRINVQVGAGESGDLALGVNDSPDPVTAIGDPITYAVAVTNNSPSQGTNVVVTSTLDANVVFNAGASDAIAVHDGSPTGGVVTASIGTMASQEISTFSFVVDTTQLGLVTTTHTVAGDEADPVPDNDEVVSETLVEVSADLSVSITDSPDPVSNPADPITYDVAVFNIGPSDATGVTVTMNLDPLTIFNGAMSDAIAMHDGSPTGGVVTANIGNLADKTGTSFIVVVDTTDQGTLVVDAAVVGNEPDPNSGNDTDIEETLYELSGDLSITIADSPDPVVGLGGQITYVVEVGNDGPSDVTAVIATITLDPKTSFVSADAPAVHAGGVVTADLGDMANGALVTFNIVVDTVAAGRTVVAGVLTSSGNRADPDPSNNSTVVNTLVLADLDCVPVGLFSNIVESTSSDVPGLPGAKFGSGCDRPFRSPDGLNWIISCDTDLATTQDEVIIAQLGGMAPTVVVQEGVTTLDLGDQVGLIDTKMSVNDMGQYAFATNTNGATSADETIVKWDGVDFVTVAREGDAALQGNYGSILRAANIIADGTVWFDGDTTIDTGIDQFLFTNDGAGAVLQEGTDIPGNQDGGAMFPWDAFDLDDFHVDATGANYSVQGDTEDPATSMDDIFAINNVIVVQEGVIVAGSGFGSPADASSPIEYGSMMSNGDWITRGGNDDNQDWVLKNGAVIATTESPILTDSPELYDDGPFSAGFFAYAGNNAGDFVIAGTTSSGEGNANAVFVLNNELVIARENDLIDLDGNGVFDDGVRIRTFGNDDLILTDDMKVYFPCTLRAADDGGSNNTDIGDAFVMLDLACLLCGNGVVDTGETCDDGNTADGDCCSATCQIEDAGTVCRASQGACDLEDTCDGASPTCPDDAFSTDVCRASEGACDPEEACDGNSADCPADVLSTDVCRPSAGACDLEEACDGISADCPADVFSTDLCRASNGVCDPEEVCDGASADCPDDLLSTDVCRPSQSACDPEEVCDGGDVDCPSNVIINDCIADDGCCPANPACNNNNDPDCAPVCGNGVVEGDEGCDDGNTDPGDGCDEVCVVEFVGIPTVSQWGLLVLALALLVAAKVFVPAVVRARSQG